MPAVFGECPLLGKADVTRTVGECLLVPQRRHGLLKVAALQLDL